MTIATNPNIFILAAGRVAEGDGRLNRLLRRASARWMAVNTWDYTSHSEAIASDHRVRRHLRSTAAI